MDREEFREKMDERLGELQTQYDELKVKASLAKADARDEIERRMKDVNHMRHDLRSRVKDIRRKGSGAWESMKEGFDHATDDLKKAFDEMRGKLKH